MASAVILKGTVEKEVEKKPQNYKNILLAENVKRSTLKKMNVETDVVHIAMKSIVSSKLFAVTSHTSVADRSGFSLSRTYLCIYIQRLIH